MRIQYSIFMSILFLFYALVSIVLLPFAYLIAIVDKMKVIGQQESAKDVILNCLIFIPFGLPILVVNLLADFYYFWLNNFESDLKKIIMIREQSKL